VAAVQSSGPRRRQRSSWVVAGPLLQWSFRDPPLVELKLGIVAHHGSAPLRLEGRTSRAVNAASISIDTAVGTRYTYVCRDHSAVIVGTLLCDRTSSCWMQSQGQQLTRNGAGSPGRTPF
jgi:hypothetical protein